jgi:hypothetical protein
MTENELAKQIVDAAYRIHIALGPGLLESVYVLTWLGNWNNEDCEWSARPRSLWFIKAPVSRPASGPT